MGDAGVAEDSDGDDAVGVFAFLAGLLEDVGEVCFGLHGDVVVSWFDDDVVEDRVADWVAVDSQVKGEVALHRLVYRYRYRYIEWLGVGVPCPG